MHDVVEVEVLKVRPSGLTVEVLETEQKGIIRRRELSWDRRIGSSVPMHQVGDVIKAKILTPQHESAYVSLSLRKLTDPWQEIKRKYEPGQPIWGEVVEIRYFGVFVQIEPGIDAIVRPETLPLDRGQQPADVLALGDQVMGKLVVFDAMAYMCEIDIYAWLQQLSLETIDNRSSIQWSLFGDSEKRREQDAVLRRRQSREPGEMDGLVYHPPISKPERILVVDDGKTDCERIVSHLNSIFGIPVEGVHSGKEAAAKIQHMQYGLVVIDLNLNDERGIDVADRILELSPSSEILFTSHDPAGEEAVSKHYVGRYGFACKVDIDEISETISKMLSGYLEEMAPKATGQGNDNFVHQLGMETLVRRSAAETLERVVDRLRSEVRAEYAILLEVDSLTREVSIMTAAPSLSGKWTDLMLDGLYYSPVRTVAEEEEEFYAAFINQDEDKRFRYFFPYLEYRTCLGIPLRNLGLMKRYALFLLNSNRTDFSFKEREKARVSAVLLQSFIEQRRWLEFMRRFEQRYTLGQLLGSLHHELSNKLEPLDFECQTLQEVVGQTNDVSDLSPDGWIAVRESVATIDRTRVELRELLHAYSRIARGALETVDVNAIAHKVKLNLSKYAGEKFVEIDIDLADDLPEARAITSSLEQVLTNVVLNAIQQIAKQRELMKKIGRKNSTTSILQKGVVLIRTRFEESYPDCPVRILVADTGPGIHYYQQRRLFQLDVSDREAGHGLGLFISRDLIENMGGRLRLVDSLMFIGSLFAIELPVFR